MKSFLSKVVTDVLHQNKVPVENLIFILPSQRSCVFLREEIIKQLSKATFLPQITSIENYIQELAEIRQIDTVQLLFEFYSVYKQNTAVDKLDEFDAFSQWATIVLQDFNEVDRHLIDSKDLFTYLRDINRLENWNPTTQITKNYFSFFEKLHLYYNQFYQYLISNKIGYQGLIYREAESNIQHYINSLNNKHVVLVGFNALNKAEEQIFQELLQSGKASIYWDVNKDYLHKTNSTGAFLRKYKQEWNFFNKNPFNWIDSNSDSVNKNIQFISTSKNVSQAKYVGELLGKIHNYTNTALVLADETQLALTLNSLPNTIDKINITMGFPLNEIPLASFFNAIFQLYLNQERMDTTNTNLFYYKDVLNLVGHSYFRKLIQINDSDIVSEIGKSNRIFLAENHIKSFFKNIGKEDFDTFNFLFENNNSSVAKTITNCIAICKELKEVVTGIELEYVYRFYTVFQQLETLNSKYKHIHNLKTLHQFFIQISSNEKLSFQGEPLEGLQLMGMLETRVIDFETVIITSVNEGVLPSSKSDKSFIPFDVKQHFNLPTYQEKDAIFSYHFFRLLQRAKNIYILYTTEVDAFGSGEKSRFLAQMELTHNNIIHKVISPSLSIEALILEQINKTDMLLNQLKELAQKGISPSALATYIYNPIDFYYQKILKIRAIDEVEETVAVNTMGTVIHETLEQLYKPFINVYLTEDSFKKMFSKVATLVFENFQKEYKNGDISTGKNKLIFEVSKKYVNLFLHQELQDVKNGKQIKIIALEQTLSATIHIENIDIPIKIHGNVDRIDYADGVLRIIDYKTGLVQPNQLKITDFSMMSDDYKYTKALQVMLYTYLYLQQNNLDFNQPIEAGIISFKNLKSGFLKMNFAEGRGKDYIISEDRMNEFLVELKRILNEIFNQNIPFIENPNKAF